jgi:hypothetical protein
VTAKVRKPLYARAPGRPACSFGLKCYRKNPDHFRDMDHPSEHPLIVAEAGPSTAHTPAAVAAAAPPAPAAATAAGGSSQQLGAKRKDPPPPVWEDDDDLDDASLAAFDIEGAAVASRAPGCKDVSAGAPMLASVPSSSSSSSAQPPPPPPYSSIADRPLWHDRLQSSFGTRFGDDVFALLELARRQKPQEPLAAFTAAGVNLLAPFRVLCGAMPLHEASPLAERGPYDPPEFQPLVRLNENGGGGYATIGYWKDDAPSAPPTLLAASRPNTTAKAGPGVTITPLDEPNLLLALHRLLTKASGSGKLVASSCAHAAEAIRGAVEDAAVDMSALPEPGCVAKSRKKATIAPTSHKMGIVVPYEKETELGYRRLHLIGADLRKLLDNIVKATDEKRGELQAEVRTLPLDPRRVRLAPPPPAAATTNPAAVAAATNPVSTAMRSWIRLSTGPTLRMTRATLALRSSSGRTFSTTTCASRRSPRARSPPLTSCSTARSMRRSRWRTRSSARKSESRPACIP